MLAAGQIDRVGSNQPYAATWRDSSSVCSLADGERHLGHVLKAGNHWLAFDATHCNESGTGFLFLGCYASITAAKRAVDQVFHENYALATTVQ
jgi:hypothetical protein